MEIKFVKIADIKPYEKNPRKNTEAVQYVKNSIAQFGFKVPMVLDKENVIVCGHTRYLAAKELSMEEVPVVYADDLSEEQIKAFRLADNKTAEMSGWDFTLLDQELGSICGLDMGMFGFRDDAIDTDALNQFYIDAEPKEKKTELVQCEACGEWFEVEV